MLKSEKVLIRPFEERDIPIFYDWINREESMGAHSDFCAVPHNDVDRSYRDGRYWSDDRKYFIIEVEGRPIGEAVIHKALNYPSAGLELAVCLDEQEYRNKGYGKEVVKLLLHYIFSNQPEINRVQAIMHVENKASIKLFEGCCFRREGILRGISFHHGMFQDSFVYSILRNEWRTSTGNTDTK